MNPIPRMLASDLDGTLIPPVFDEPRVDEIRRFGEAVSGRRLRLAYVTGRDLDLAVRGIERFGLPEPELLVCDVGTSVYVRARGRGAAFVPDDPYRARMLDALGGATGDDIVGALSRLAGLTLQEGRRQAEFKVSYYVDPEHAAALRVEVPGALAAFAVPPKAVWSHDPHSGRMLLDLLPRGVAKHTALEHVREQAGFTSDEVVYAGDSGNDFDAFLSGHPVIVVANTPDELKREVRSEGAAAGIADKLYFADAPFAGGVLEGCRHFGAL